MTKTNLPNHAEANNTVANKPSYLKGMLAGAAAGAASGIPVMGGLEALSRAQGHNPSTLREWPAFALGAGISTAIGAVSGGVATYAQRRSSPEPQSHADRIRTEQQQANRTASPAR